MSTHGLVSFDEPKRYECRSGNDHSCTASCERGATPRTAHGCRIPADPVAARRFPLSASADLLAICRRSFCTVWVLGWRLDDTRAPAALPAFRNIGP